MILKSELDEDVKKIIDSLQSRDYYIPTIWMIASPVLKLLQPFYILVVVCGVFSWTYHGPYELWSASIILIFSIAGSLLISFISIGVLYYPSILLFCISDTVKQNSFLCVKFSLLIKRTAFIVHVIGFFISIPFVLMIGWGFLVPFGAYFVLILLCYNILGSVICRYLTPEVINVISNFKKNMSQTIDR